MTDWGKGGITNNIGWQKCYDTPSSWAIYYNNSYNGDTDLLCILFPTSQTVDNFNLRVIQEGGVIEALNCTTDIVSALNELI
jgi:hypothetical protein